MWTKNEIGKNENDRNMGKTLVSKTYNNEDGIITWVYSMKIETPRSNATFKIIPSYSGDLSDLDFDKAITASIDVIAK